MARYRFRTWLRRHVPWSVAEHIPKGRDCGAHEWSFIEEGRWGCYHCEQETTECPWPEAEWARRRLGAIYRHIGYLLMSEVPGAEIEEELVRYGPEIARLRPLLAEDAKPEQERLGLGMTRRVALH